MESDKNKMLEVLKFLSENLYRIIVQAIEQNSKYNIEKNLREIRIRIQRPIILKLQNYDILIEYRVADRDIMQTLERLCENSIYAYKNQIKEGFITIKGGHRVGIVGTGIVENGEIVNLKNISSLNFRIAREVKGCADRIIKEIVNKESNTIYNTLLVSPPGKGKTTMLRDIIRQLSNGIEEIGFSGLTCGIVDERGEIAACYKGIPQNDIGIRSDVIENVSKEKGIKILLRSMSPEIIACDEIGTKEDVQAIKLATISGVKRIFTMHGKNMTDVKNNLEINNLVESHLIEKIFFL